MYVRWHILFGNIWRNFCILSYVRMEKCVQKVAHKTSKPEDPSSRYSDFLVAENAIRWNWKLYYSFSVIKPVYFRNLKTLIISTFLRAYLRLLPLPLKLIISKFTGETATIYIFVWCSFHADFRRIKRALAILSYLARLDRAPLKLSG